MVTAAGACALDWTRGPRWCYECGLVSFELDRKKLERGEGRVVCCWGECSLSGCGCVSSLLFAEPPSILTGTPEKMGFFRLYLDWKYVCGLSLILTVCTFSGRIHMFTEGNQQRCLWKWKITRKLKRWNWVPQALLNIRVDGQRWQIKLT